MTNFILHPFYTQDNSLDCKPVVDEQEKQEKEEVMYNKSVNMDINVNTLPAMPAEQSETQQAREHLNMRLNQTFYQKRCEAETTFELLDDPAPRTGKELLDRITKGQYIFDAAGEEALEKKGWNCYGPFAFMSWRDPARVKDVEGYEAFAEKLSEARDTALDEIAIFSPEKGLESLRTFQAIPVN